MDFPCPYCDASFVDPYLLEAHALKLHKGGNMLTKDDFHQIDSHLVTAAGGFIFSIEPNVAGNFSLVVYGQLANKVNSEISQREPNSEQWADMLAEVNQIVQAVRIARSREI